MMTRSRYVPDDPGTEVVAPSGYYQPLAEASLEYEGRSLLYTLGTVCIETSCCGAGSWGYVRVEGYALDTPATGSQGRPIEIETIDDPRERAAIGRLLLEKHPGARVEFR
jgi:hypothetical protein